MAYDSDNDESAQMRKTRSVARSERELLAFAEELIAREGADTEEGSEQTTSALEGALFQELLREKLPDEGPQTQWHLDSQQRQALLGLGLRIEEEIGRGGMGVVYRAVDEGLQRTVAVKAVGIGSSGAVRQRFRREALLLSQLNHPSICQVYRLIESTEYGFAAESEAAAPPSDLLVLEYIEGSTLDAIAFDELPFDEQLSIAQQIAEALDSAHSRGVVHRDLKPGNVILRPDGVVKVLDFGIARSHDHTAAPEVNRTLGPAKRIEVAAPSPAPALTQSSTILGTPGYMSPEQVRGEVSGPPTDLWALGVLLQNLFALGPVFSEGEEVLPQVARARTLPATGGDAELCGLVNELKSADPGSRPAAGEVALRLREIRRRPLRQRRRRWFAAIAAVAVFALVLAVVLPWRERSRSQERVRQAQRIGSELLEIENELRAATLLPLHSIEPTKMQLRARLDRLLLQLDEQTGDPALSAYAAGRGELALGHAAAARPHLERAWDLGLREPKLEEALGLALAQLYSAARLDLDAIPDEQVRKATAKSIERELRDPAVRWLQQASAGSQSDLLDAEVHLLLARRQQVIDELDPETVAPLERGRAHLLRGRAFLALAEAARAVEGEDPGVHMAASRAEFERGLEFARSSPQLHLARCRLEVSAMSHARDQGSGPLVQEMRRDVYELATRSCEAAVRVDPGEPTPYLQLAQVHRLAAFDLQHRDNTAAMDAILRSAETLETARERFDEHPRVALAWLEHLSRLAEVRQIRGEPVDQQLEEISRLGESVVQALPGNAQAILTIGFAEWTLGFEHFVRGDDPRPAFERAIEHLGKAVDLAPSSSNIHNMLGTAQGMLGLSMMERGEDPRESLQACIESFERAVELYPNNPYPRANMGMAYRDLADYAVLLGEDPREHIPPGIETLEEARARREDYPDTWLTQAELELARVRWWMNLAPGGTDSESLAEAIAGAGRAQGYLRTALEMNTHLYGAKQRLAEALLLEAESRMAQGQRPEATLTEAEQLLERRLQEESDAYRPLVARSHAARLRARLADDGAQTRYLEQALELTERAIASTASAAPHMERARVLAAMASARAGGRADLEARLEEALAEALRRNSNLEHEAERIRTKVRS